MRLITPLALLCSFAPAVALADVPPGPPPEPEPTPEPAPEPPPAPPPAPDADGSDAGAEPAEQKVAEKSGADDAEKPDAKKGCGVDRQGTPGAAVALGILVLAGLGRRRHRG